MFGMVFDYSRWISNWAVCMILILHAVKMLPAKQEAALIPAEDRNTNILGLIVTHPAVLRRLGLTMESVRSLYRKQAGEQWSR